MRVLTWVIAIFALAVGLSMFFSRDWGVVQFVIPSGNKTVEQTTVTSNQASGQSVIPSKKDKQADEQIFIESSVKFFVVTQIALIIAAYLLIRLVQRTLSLPKFVGQWRERRRRQRADSALREAVLTFYEGRYAQALKLAEKAYKASDQPASAILLAARSAHALSDDARYREWIARLNEEGEQFKTACLITEAELAIASHHFKEASDKLDTLQQDGRRHIAALRLSLQVAVALKYWEEVIHLARLLRKHKALTEAQAKPHLYLAHIERLREHADNGEALAQVWDSIPTAEREDRHLVAEAVPLLAHEGKGHIARRTLERLLDNEWDTALARLYGLCGDTPEAITACLEKGEEKWQPLHRRDPGLLFSLGRLCVESRLWGKAESYFKTSLDEQPEIETHLALAHLFDALARTDDAQRHYRAAAEMAVKLGNGAVSEL
ncbi:MAG: heme biosynthesis protein HemY [Azoarcus sp.]|jgi:HemY protein|nr:heme biosynthesis protein HemY [Azoarcus sp.]